VHGPHVVYTGMYTGWYTYPGRYREAYTGRRGTTQGSREAYTSLLRRQEGLSAQRLLSPKGGWKALCAEAPSLLREARRLSAQRLPLPKEARRLSAQRLPFP